ncbi:MAG: hypothetical protein K2H89_07910 [Oscillospiraceae bacterium]|nr:hypothetical protein [Oscillospiraceae bacterium]
MTDTNSETIPETSENGRYLCADVLSCLGVMLLLGLQYIQQTGFLDATVSYESAPFIAIRWFCLSGAMLLCGCMGYVLSTKKFSLHSFKPLLRLGYLYLITSLCTMLLQKFLFEQEMNLDTILKTLYQFTATDTTKFIAMYFALLLAAPFLSTAFQGLKTRNARLAFVVISAAVSTLQPMLIISGEYLLPEWCKMLAPVAGFVGGAFVKRYAREHSRILWLFLLLLVWGGQTACVVYICTDRGILYYPQFDSMASMLSLLTALLMLSLFHSKKRGESGRHSFFAGASGGALSALILGDVIIDFLMPSITENFPDPEMLMLVGCLAVLVVFILCCTIGLFLQIPVFLVSTFTDTPEYEEDDENNEEPETEEEKIPETPVRKPFRALEPILEVIPKPEPMPETIHNIPVSAPETKIIPAPEPVPELKEPKQPVKLQTPPYEKKTDQLSKESIDELIAKITGN